MPIAWSGAKTNINSNSTPVSTVSSQSLRSLRKWRKSLMGSRIIVRCSDVKNVGSESKDGVTTKPPGVLPKSG